MKRSRFPDFPRGPDGKILRGPNGRLMCRGCKVEEVPANRQSWHSNACLRKFHPFYVKMAVWHRDNGLCQMCGVMTLRPGRRESKFWSDPPCEIDHIIPHSEGGLFVLENARVLCPDCHRKRTKDWHRERVLKRMQLSVPKDWVEVSVDQFWQLLDQVDWARDAYSGCEYFNVRGRERKCLLRHDDKEPTIESFPIQVALHTTVGYYVNPEFFSRTNH